MTNRPRSRQPGKPATTIDIKAERIDGSRSSPPAGGGEAPAFIPEDEAASFNAGPELPVTGAVWPQEGGKDDAAADTAGAAAGTVVASGVAPNEEPVRHDPVSGPPTAGEFGVAHQPSGSAGEPRVKDSPLGEAASSAESKGVSEPDGAVSVSEPLPDERPPAEPAWIGPKAEGEAGPSGAATVPAGRPSAPASAGAEEPFRADPQAEGHSAAGGTSFGKLLAAGVLGAVLALGGGAALQSAGYLGGAENDPVSGPPAAGSQELENVQRLTADVVQLRSEMEALRAAVPAEAPPAAAAADLTALTERLAGLEARAGEGAAAGQAAAEAAGAVQQTADQAAQAAAAAQASAGEAATAAQAAQQTGDAASQAAETAGQAAQAAGQAAESATQTAAAAQGAAEAASQAVSGFEQRLAGVEQQIAGVAEAGRQAGVAVAAAGLKAAIDRGGPFMGELEAFASVAGPSAPVESLRNFAAQGVPSLPTLREEWGAVEEDILAALRPADPNADLGEQVLTGLKSLVTVRPVEPAAGGAPAAVTSRLSAALAEGDLRAWLREWESLPQPAKEASQDFAGRVRARAEAQTVVDDTLNGAITAAGTQG